MFNLLILKLITMSVPYYYNPKMHSFGNIGFGGKIHATIAPYASRAIDILRYDGRNIREEIISVIFCDNLHNSIVESCS